MKIKNFLSENTDSSNILLITSVDDLKEVFDYVLTEHDRKLKEVQEREKDAEIFLSQKETAAKLGITIPTLWSWEQKGAISKIKIGHKVRYRLSDVNKILRGGVFI